MVLKTPEVVFKTPTSATVAGVKYKLSPRAAPPKYLVAPETRGLHSFTFQLNLSRV